MSPCRTDEPRHKTVEFKERLQMETLDDVAIEAYVTVREASSVI